MPDNDVNVIMDRVFYWKTRTTRDRNRYVAKGPPHSPILGLLVDSRAFHATGMIPSTIRVRVEVIPQDLQHEYEEYTNQAANADEKILSYEEWRLEAMKRHFNVDPPPFTPEAQYRSEPW